MSVHSFRPLVLGHAAWAMLEILAVAEHVRSVGRCVGELWARQLYVNQVTVARAQRQMRLVNTVMASVHERRGHDRGCEVFGISERVLRRILRSWARSVDGIPLLVEALEEAFIEVNQGYFERPVDAVRWLVENRVTSVWLHNQGPVRVERGPAVTD